MQQNSDREKTKAGAHGGTGGESKAVSNKVRPLRRGATAHETEPHGADEEAST
jgi:hypothetical protein